MGKRKLNVPVETFEQWKERRASCPHPIKGGITSGGYFVSSDIGKGDSKTVIDKISAAQMMTAFGDPQLVSIGKVSADELTERLAAFRDRCFKEIIPLENMAIHPLMEDKCFLTDHQKEIIKQAMEDPNLVITLTISKKSNKL